MRTRRESRFGSFNSRSRGGSDKIVHRRLGAGVGFQFTLPRGERLDKARALIADQIVSIHAPAGGATRRTPCRPHPLRRFNSRSRGGSDTRPATFCAGTTSVSIHAPAGGATRHHPRRRRTPARFNSRSRGGSDSTPTPPYAPTPMFQFTLPRGERPARSAKAEVSVLVSIHAPAGGATARRRPMKTSRLVSIHAPAGGATGSSPARTCTPSRFQFTLPRGERHRRPPALTPNERFQFTLPRGERQVLTGTARPFTLFQFTLPRGERRLRD